MVLHDVVVGGQEKSAGAAGGIADRFAGLRGNDLHHRVNQRTRREVLARAALGVLRRSSPAGLRRHRPFTSALSDGPVLFVDQVDDQPPQLGRVLDLVLGLA